MNILFYKLLAYNELKEEADYILNSRDQEYALKNQLRVCDYNPIDELKKLEDDIDSQVLTSIISDVMNTRPDCESLHDLIEYFDNLHHAVHETLHFEKCIMTQIYHYLKLKELK